MHPFIRKTPTPEQAATMAAIGKDCASLYEDISAAVPDSLYKTEALKHLEIVGMMVNKGITHGAT